MTTLLWMDVDCINHSIISNQRKKASELKCRFSTGTTTNKLFYSIKLSVVYSTPSGTNLRRCNKLKFTYCVGCCKLVVHTLNSKLKHEQIRFYKINSIKTDRSAIVALIMKITFGSNQIGRLRREKRRFFFQVKMSPRENII